MTKSKIQEILTKHGISQAELVRISGLSIATVANCYHGKGNPSEVTKSKLVIGINKLIEKESYSILNVFPE